MIISDRLLKIASMVDKCNVVADIGTDHGYIPIHLIKNNVCNLAIASDINDGPVKKATFNVSIEGLSDKISCRKGGGLNTLKVNEANVVIIAGMGGNLIRDIIEEKKNIFSKLEYAILQPAQNPEVLRKHLYEQGYQILQEELCFDEGIYYEILKVRCGNNKQVKTELEYEIAPLLIENNHPLVKDFINSKIDRNNKIAERMEIKTEAAMKRKESLIEKNNKLKEILDSIC